ncbi:hypothetical protein B0H16DRAFT_1587907 [Mycena metata]|uniref:Novel STAND NTPase 1 domain-containing protein n=1 Tax=Mycena metata TaxID=1033252 RepID=A0AAD7HWI5_9AGAR|nr:hypothetical protein B0H16DRAFT_1587907 [Mycena metata]
MPRATPKVANGIRILQHTTAAVRLLLNVSDNNSNNPYLKAVAGITLMVLETVQTVKSNKSQCFLLLEQIHVIISAIINLCGDNRVLAPTTLRDVSQFLDTLQKVHSFVRSQVDLGLFQRVLRHSETMALLEECNAGLNYTINIFGIQTSLSTNAEISDLRKIEDTRHEEVLHLLEQANSTRSTFSNFYQGSSSSSLFLLPSSPQIYHGRDSELEELQRLLIGGEPYRAAILGPGGIGKSSLALALLHHPNVVSHFGSQRYFISLESSTSASDMFSAIAAFFNIEETPKLSRAIVRYLFDLAQPSVLVLDNLEDCWEAPTSRSEIEDFLSLLSEIPDLQLMVTMRGAERPAKVKWTRPFLPPLDRLNDAAAKQTFLDISDEDESDDLTALLTLTDNLPLAITLMANLTSFEGAQSVLKRWEGETTSLLSEGFAKQANLEKSIAVSLSSPRMLSDRHAQKLLSLMSLLPDGMSEEALQQMNLPFSTYIAGSKSTLLRCSLIYVGPDGRLRTLAPIRQYVREKFPPDVDLFDGLLSYLYELASLFRVPMDLPNRELIQRLSYEFANVRAVAAYVLSRSLRLEDTVRCIIDLMHFNASAKSGPFELSQSVEEAVERVGDPVLKGDYLLAQARVSIGRPPCLPLVSDALRCFEEKDDVFGQVRALYTFASHLSLMGQFQNAIEKATRGARLAQQSNNLAMQALCMTASSKAYRSKGDLRAALAHGSEARRISQVSGNLTAEVWVSQQYASCCVMVGDYTAAGNLCAAITSILSALGLANTDVHAYRNLLNVSAEISNRRTEYEAALALRLQIYQSRRTFDDLPKTWDLLNIALIEIELGDLVSAEQRVQAARHAVSPTVWKQAGIDIFAEVVEGNINFHKGPGYYSKAREGLRRVVTNADWIDLAMPAMETLGDLAFKTSDMRTATRYSVLLLVSAYKADDLAAKHQALRRIGDIYLSRADTETALILFQIAVEGFRLMGVHRGIADCLIRMGDIWQERGDQAKAKATWTEARPLFEKSSQKADIIRCDQRFA